MSRLWGILLLVPLVVTPLFSYADGLAQTAQCSGPDCQICNVVFLVNGVIGWLVLILGTVAAIIIVYAGFKLVTSGGNKHAMEEAKSLINNMIIGYVIVLGGWLLVDTFMKMLLADGQTSFGVWNQVSCVKQPIPNTSDPYKHKDFTPAPTIESFSCDGTSGSYSCRHQVESCELRNGSATVDQNTGKVTCVTPASGGTYTPDGLGQCSSGNSACSVSALQAAGLTAQQANIMSCIAMTESSGIASTPPFNETHKDSNSTACGTFQIVKSTWNNYASGSCKDFRSNCQNANCNKQVMVNLVRSNGYSDWTCPNCNKKAKSCIQKYK